MKVSALDQVSRGEAMPYAIAALLVVLWLTGLVASYTMGGLIHVFLLIAIVVVLLDISRRQNAFGTKD